MKTLLLFLTLALFLTFGCGHADDRIEAFIPGLYVRTFADSTDGLQTRGNDTLLIKDAGNARYEIKRTLSVQRTVAGAEEASQFKTEKWRGTYDKEKRVLLETTRTRSFHLFPKGTCA